MDVEGRNDRSAQQSNLYKETLLGGKPFFHCVLLLKKLPIYNYGPYLGFPLNPDLSRAIDFITNKVPVEELKIALKKPKGFAFRGLIRTIGSKEYDETIHSIEEQGVDRGGPNREKTWFDDEPDFPFQKAIPHDQQKVGLLIISKSEGMINMWGEDYPTEGVKLKEGHSFKDLHVGTIQIVVDPPMNK